MNILNAEREYQIREKEYTEQFDKENLHYKIWSRTRVITFLLIIVGVILFFYKDRFFGSLLLICTLAAFVISIVQQVTVKKRKELAFSLAEINRMAIDRMNGKWVEFADNGEEFIDQAHRYSVDLDVFGQASLFQWINNTFTFLGRTFLKNTLTEPPKDAFLIEERQAAIEELAGKLDWRQHFLAEGRALKGGISNPEPLFEWAETENQIFRLSWLIWCIRFISFSTVTSLFLPFLKGVDYLYIPAILLFGQFIFFMIGLKFYWNAYEVTVRYKDEIFIFQKLLSKIEMEGFESKYLSRLKSNLMDSDGKFASDQINELSFITGLMNLKYNPLFYFIANVIFLFDYHCIIKLEQWKKISGCSLRTWLTVIGEFEEISSLSTIRHDHSSWCTPQLTASKHYLYAENMGHPLLFSTARVCNDLNIKGSGNVLLITGSNMSGKSTLLRTVGLNLILAYIGAPVCADSFKCSIMNIYTSMRVNDNLEKKISSFYAELLRIKMILTAAGESNSILFLLDEIFKGTNSKDRFIGAAAVIRKLSKMQTIGLVSTHDLELGELENEQDINVENYHFAETYLNNQISFDYKLRPGVSKTTNAIYLMRMVGIDEL